MNWKKMKVFEKFKQFKQFSMLKVFNKNLGSSQRYTGFTLAEVLITLGIIGLVAALTIPTLIAKNQKKEYTTKLKKTYSQFNQALLQIASDNGCPGDLACTGFFSPSSSNETIGNVLVQYIKIAKNCKIETNKGCWNPTNFYYTGTSTSYRVYDNTLDYKFIGADGVSYKISNQRNNCIYPNVSTGRTGNMNQVCAQLTIDINGLKPPNNYGRDVFDFFITNGKGPILYPRGGADDNWSGDGWWHKGYNQLSPTYCYESSKAGFFCAGRVIEENWQMNY